MSLSLYNLIHDACLALLLLHTVDILENLVHLLERLARRLRNAEECKQKCKKTEDSEEGVRAVAGILNQGRGDEALVLSVHVQGRNDCIEC